METKFYTNIDELPLYHWRKINESNDLSWLMKKKCRIKWKKTALALQKQWEIIYDSFIDAFEKYKDIREILYLKRDILVLEMQMNVDKDEFLINFIEIKQAELKAKLENTSGTMTFAEVKYYVAKHMGFPINEKEISVRDYYTALEKMKEKNNGG